MSEVRLCGTFMEDRNWNLRLTHRMQLTSNLAVVASWTILSLVRCDDVVITTRRNLSSRDTTTIDIRLSLDRFTEFYECLCQATTQQCAISGSSSTGNLSVTPTDMPGKHPIDGLACRQYGCQYTGKTDNLVCTEEASASCHRLIPAQVLYHRDAVCNSTKCVAFAWRYADERIDYSAVSTVVGNCTDNCECATETVPTTPSTTATAAAVTATKAVSTAASTTEPVVLTSAAMVLTSAAIVRSKAAGLHVRSISGFVRKLSSSTNTRVSATETTKATGLHEGSISGFVRKLSSSTNIHVSARKQTKAAIVRRESDSPASWKPWLLRRRERTTKRRVSTRKPTTAVIVHTTAAAVHIIPTTQTILPTSSSSISTTETTTQTTLETRTTQKTTTANPVTVLLTEAITNQTQNPSTKTKILRSKVVSDSQTQTDTVHIIVVAVVAPVVVAVIAAVAVLLWKRKRARIHKSSTDVHEYVNLPVVSLCGNESDMRVNLDEGNQDPGNVYINCDIVISNYEYDHDVVDYVIFADQTSDNVAGIVHFDTHGYAKYISCTG